MYIAYVSLVKGRGAQSVVYSCMWRGERVDV